MQLYGEKITKISIYYKYINFLSGKKVIGTCKINYEEDEDIGERIYIVDFDSPLVDEEGLDGEEIDEIYQPLKDVIYDNEISLTELYEKLWEDERHLTIYTSDFINYYGVDDEDKKSKELFLTVKKEEWL